MIDGTHLASGDRNGDPDLQNSYSCVLDMRSSFAELYKAWGYNTCIMCCFLLAMKCAFVLAALPSVWHFDALV